VQHCDRQNAARSKLIKLSVNNFSVNLCP